MLAAMIATIPFLIFAIREHFPWYSYVGIFAGELLLVYVSGFISSVFLLPLIALRTSWCKDCGAPMLLAGRHFDPAGSVKPHWSDFVIFVLFVGLNIATWIELAKSNF
jgi:hypothetical protein